MSRTKIKEEIVTSAPSPPTPAPPKIKCEFYPQDFPQQFQCGVCGAVLEEDSFTEHVRSHYHPPVKYEEEEEEEDVKPVLSDIQIPEVDIPDSPPPPSPEREQEISAESFPFPIIDFPQNRMSKNGRNNVIYTCQNPNNLYYKCDKCSFTSSKHTLLDEHKKKHVKKPKIVDNNILKCSKCTFYTSSSEMYAMHCRRHRKRRIEDVQPMIDIKREHVF